MRNRTALAVTAWAWVALPFAYGVYELVRKASRLFTG
ncbi:MFS transporter small subunit [Streptomyces sparsogenes]